MEPLVEALGERTQVKVREAAAAIRSSLKNNPENKARLLAAGGIDSLIERLGSGGRVHRGALRDGASQHVID